MKFFDRSGIEGFGIFYYSVSLWNAAEQLIIVYRHFKVVLGAEYAVHSAVLIPLHANNGTVVAHPYTFSFATGN